MQKFFRFLMVLFRAVFGVTFIVSGILKLIDPVGTGLVVSEYFSSFGVTFLKPLSIFSGAVLSMVELTVGMAVLMRLRIRFLSMLALCLTVFFTIVTFILYKFNPIDDCGCFGEAIHLTNGQTFVKNLLLLVCIIPVFLYRKQYEPVASPLAEWIFLGCHFVAACILSIYVFRTEPLVEFGDFRAGTHIQDKMTDGWNGESGDVYVYEKDGFQRSFTLSEIPDSSWHFVETVTETSGGESGRAFDFAVSDIDGRYITDSLLNHVGPVVLFSVYDPDALEEEEWENMMEITGHLNGKGIFARILTTAVISDTAAAYCAISDYKTLISLSRSNGGVVILDSGAVIEKGYRGEFSEDELLGMLEDDSDELISYHRIIENMLLELVFVLLAASILLFRFFCGLKRDKMSRAEV